MTADNSPMGMLLCGSFRSPDMFTPEGIRYSRGTVDYLLPARTPRKLAKKTPKTVKKDDLGWIRSIPSWKRSEIRFV